MERDKLIATLTIFLPLFVFFTLLGVRVGNLAITASSVPPPFAAVSERGRVRSSLALNVRQMVGRPGAAGDTDGSGSIDLDDLICVNSVIDNDYSFCSFNQADIFPCRENELTGDGLVDENDLLAVQRGFAGQPLCQLVTPACIDNRAPVARLAVTNPSPLAGTPTMFMATDSSDADPGADGNWQIVEYRLDFGDGEEEITSGRMDQPVWAHIYRQPGIYSATLTVLDRCNAAAITNTPVSVMVSQPGGRSR